MSFCFATLTRLTAFSIITLLSLSFAWASPTMTLQGRIVTPQGAVLQESGVKIRAQVLTSDSYQCILFDETHTVDMTSSDGLFTIALNDGNGTRIDTNGWNFISALSNGSSFSIPSANCASGSGTLVYSPSAVDERKVAIYFKTTSMATWEEMTDPNARPMLSHSSYAMESSSITGFGIGSLCRISDSGVPVGVTPLTSANYADLLSLIAGTSTKYMTRDTASGGGASLPSYNGAPTSSSAGDIWYDSSSNQIKYNNGTVTPQVLGVSGAGITSLIVGAGLTPASTTITTGGSTIAVDTGTTAGKIVQVQAGGKLPALNGSDLTNINATSITSGTIGGSTAISTTGNIVTTGSVTSSLSYLYDHAGAGPGYVGFKAPLSATSYVVTWPAAVGSANQVLSTDALGNLSWTTPAVTSAVSVSSPITNSGSGAAPVIGIQQATTAQAGFLSSGDWNAFNSKQSSSLTSANLWVGNSSNVATATAPSGDVSMTNGGVFTVTALQGRSVATTAPVDAQTLVWSGILNKYIPVSFSGDATISNLGVVTLKSTGTAGNYYKVITDNQGRVTAGNTSLAASDIPSLDWTKITTGKPTTLSGFGITDSLVNNLGGSPGVASGLDGAYPGSPAAGTIFFATDTKIIYQYNSSAWTVMAKNSGSTPGGSASGDLAGSYPGPSVAKLNGTSLSAAAPADKQFLVYNSSSAQWMPVSLSGDATATAVGVISVGQVGGSTSANIHSAEQLANAATSSSAASTIVKRDISGGFSAGIANLNTANLSNLIINDQQATPNTATLVAPAAISSSYTLTLPTALGSANQVLTTNAAGVLSWTTPALTSAVAVTSPITNSGTGAAPTIGIQQATTGQSGYLSSGDWNTFNGKLSTALASAKIWVGSAGGVASAVTPTVDVSVSNTGAFTVVGIQGISVSAAPTLNGQVLRYNGSTITPNFVAITDLRSSITGTNQFASSCTNSQTLTYNAIGDFMSCQNISVGAANFSSQTANTFLVAPNGSAGTPTFRTIAAADLPMVGTAGTYGSATQVPVLTTDAYGRVTSVTSTSVVADATTLTGVVPVANGGLGASSLTGAGIFSNGGNSFGSNATLGTGDAFSLNLSTSGSPRVTILSGGNVGIGTTAPVSKLHLGVAPTASANYGLLSLGSGAFDGATIGFFTGSSNGTVAAMNTVSGYNGDLVNFQVAGSSKFKVDANGNVTTAGTFNAGTGGGSTAVNVNTTGSGNTSINNGTNTGSLTLGNSTGGVTVAGTLNMSSQSITGLGSNLTGSSALTIAAGGTAQNLTLSSATTGSVNLGSGNGTSLSVIDGGASTVNYLTIQGAATAASPTLSSAGADANIGMNITTKGTGGIYLNTASANGIVALQNAGNTRILASATQNYMSNSNVDNFSVNSYSFAAAPRFSFAGAADTSLTASTEATSTYFNLGQTRQHATGALTLQRDFRLTPSTHSFVGVSSLTNAAGFSVDGPPAAGANATLTNSSAIYVPTSALNTSVTNSYGLNVSASTGATNNYAAIFPTGNVGIGTATPAFALDVSGDVRGGIGPASLTTLSAGALSTDTSIVVVSTTGYPTAGVLYVYNASSPFQKEVMSYTGVTSTTFTGLTRGLYGTAAIALSVGYTVDHCMSCIGINNSTAPVFFQTQASGLGIGALPQPWTLAGGVNVNGQIQAAGIIANIVYQYGASTVSMYGNSGGTSADYWYLNTNRSTRIYADGSGNVGVNTGIPRGPFEVMATPSTTLSASITSATTSIGVSANTLPATGTVLVDSEQMTYSGGGTTTLTVVRGANSTTAASHSNRANVAYYGASSFIVNSTGNVGIGTTTPLGMLDVYAPTKAATNWTRISGNIATYNPPATASTGLIVGWNLTNGQGETNLVWGTGLGSTPALTFSTWSGTTLSEVMRIQPTGNVGIGTSSPSATLDVKGHIANSGSAATVVSCGTSPTISGNDAKGTVTIGSGGITSCVITFNSAYTSTPVCVGMWNGSSPPAATLSGTAATGTFTVYFSSSVSSGSFSYHCMQ